MSFLLPVSTCDCLRSARRGQRADRNRRGALAVSFLWFLVIGVLGLAVAVNWAWLVLVQRNMQERADAIALAAAPELLDEDLLRCQPADQSDDLEAAEFAAHEYRGHNNDAGPTSLELKADNVTITPGNLPDATQARAQWQPDELPYNALRVDISRSQGGTNPVAYLLSGFGSETGANVSATSLATLDNLVVGFQPTATANAPVLPLAIEAATWDDLHSGDQNQNGIKELTLVLSCGASGQESNTAVVSFDGSLEPTEVLEQIASGVTRFELPDERIGPASSTSPLMLIGTQKVGPVFAGQLAGELQQIAAEPETAARAFPLYGQKTDFTFGIVGFVAARVLGADVVGKKLIVVIEPCFLIHTTAWTDPSAEEPNMYIHKLRLAR